jgi:hypothetical protein
MRKKPVLILLALLFAHDAAAAVRPTAGTTRFPTLRAASGATQGAATTAAAEQEVVEADTAPLLAVRDGFLRDLMTYRESVEAAKAMCLSAELSVDDAIGGLGTLLGAGIASLVSGGTGAITSGANIKVTSDTIKMQEKIKDIDEKIAELEKGKGDAEKERNEYNDCKERWKGLSDVIVEAGGKE